MASSSPAKASCSARSTRSAFMCALPTSHLPLRERRRCDAHTMATMTPWPSAMHTGRPWTVAVDSLPRDENWCKPASSRHSLDVLRRIGWPGSDADARQEPSAVWITHASTPSLEWQDMGDGQCGAYSHRYYRDQSKHRRILRQRGITSECCEQPRCEHVSRRRSGSCNDLMSR